LAVFTIYPAIDLRQGSVVRLRQGNPDHLTRFSDDPSAIAHHWFESGAGWLHVVNLDGAFGESDTLNRKAIQAILNEAARAGAKVQLGGGIRSFQDIQSTFEEGVDRLVIGTLAVEQPQILARALEEFGPDRIAVGVDARDGFVRVHGWKQAAGKSVLEFADELAALGLVWLIFTDIARDGLGVGLNLGTTAQITKLPALKVIASGGVHAQSDIENARLAGCAGVIVGRALYDRQLEISQWEYL